MKKNAIFFVILLALVLAGLFFASSQSYQEQDLRGTIAKWVNLKAVAKLVGDFSFTYGKKEISINENGTAGFVEFFIRKATHFLTFSFITLLFYLVIRRWARPSAAIPWSGLLTVFLAVLDEWHQTYTPGRTGMLTDVILDSTGVFLVMAILALWSLRRGGTREKKRKWK